MREKYSKINSVERLSFIVDMLTLLLLVKPADQNSI